MADAMTDTRELRQSWRDRAPFSAEHAEKDAFFRQEMKRLTEYHRRSCRAYDDICHGVSEGSADGPYLPVALFKDLELRSVPREAVVRQVTSSGTTGQRVSRIFLDGETAELQRWALASITGDFIGGKRIPMLIIDSPDVLRDRSRFSARGAGILGFSMMSSRRFYALNEKMQPDWDSIEAFQEAAAGGPSFAFGFTFMIWSCLYESLKREGKTLDLEGCYLIHGGGWKKLQDRAVSDEIFRRELRKTCGFGGISDYYGMAEQTGSIFMQCSEGHLHASVYSDIEILDPLDFSPCEPGRWGLIALRSWLPTSYPGHMLLTEDWGRILGEDDCPCGRKGKYFQVSGRIRKAEIRGCSDTFGGGSDGTGGSGADEGELQVLAGQWPPRGWQEETENLPVPAGGAADVGKTACFDPRVMAFLEELSRLFMKDPEYRQYPDIYALGFWLRPAHLRQLQQRQEGLTTDLRQGRGLVLHIAPSNMPAMFAYSWITSLLAGNANVVRISGRDAQITDTILQGIRSLLEKPEYEDLKRRNAFVRFPRGHRALEQISRRAAARVIWGGDRTVDQICAVEKAEGTIDITFPDKYSLAVLDEGAIAGMTEEELRLQADLFCRDTYGADQNACSSPRSVFWLRRGTGADAPGDGCAKAEERPENSPAPEETKRRWWEAVAKEAERYELQAWMATEKYRLLCMNYAEHRDLQPLQAWTNRLYVIPCGNAANRDPGRPLPEAKLGMFYEFDLEDLTQLFPLLGAKIQTVVCVGCDPDSLLKSVREKGCPGVDRAVVAGEALEFDTVWDRKDLIGMLSGERAEG